MFSTDELPRKKMKIGIVRGDLTGAGGAERYALNLVRALDKRGENVHVFTARAPEDLPATKHIFRMRRRPKLPRVLRARAFGSWLRRESQSANLDLLFTMERTFPSDVFRAGDGLHSEWMKIFLRDASFSKKLVTRINGFHGATLRAEKELFKPQHTRFVVCNSQMVADEIARTYAYPAERMRVVPNGVDAEYFRPASPAQRAQQRAQMRVAPDEVLVLFAGSGFWRKGLDIALEIVAQLPRNVRFFVAGKGDTKPLRAQAARLGIAERVEFFGGKAPEEMLALYQIADLFLFPTRYDPFANVCLEANACGVPVVTTTRNGFSEHILEGRNGVIIDLDNGAASTDKIARLCDNLDDAKAQDVRASIAHLTLDSHVAALLDVLQKMPQSP